MSRWKEYLGYLDGGPYGVQLLSSDLAQKTSTSKKDSVGIQGLNYNLWPFQERILQEMGMATYQA